MGAARLSGDRRVLFRHRAPSARPGRPALYPAAPVSAVAPFRAPWTRGAGNARRRPASGTGKDNTMKTDVPAYGLWGLVIINSLVFIIFAFSFTRPRTSRDWRSFGAFSAFLVALFTEMYGFPLTIYLLSGWLQSRYPRIDWFSHDGGHLLEELLGWRANPHFGPFHLLSNILIFAGFILLAAAWDVLYKAQRDHRLATTGV